jgi:hypothetical protein
MTPSRRLKVAQPLPECPAAACGRPVRRETWLANGGRCTAHANANDAAALQLELGLLDALEDGDR